MRVLVLVTITIFSTSIFADEKAQAIEACKNVVNLYTEKLKAEPVVNELERVDKDMLLSMCELTKKPAKYHDCIAGSMKQRVKFLEASVTCESR